MKTSFKISLCLIALMLAACAKNLNSNTYSEGATAGKVLEGKIISARPVTIKAHDKLQENETGGLMGGAAGLAAGSAFGNGSGNTGAAIGGAILGAVAGAMAEDAMSTSQGMEYLVKIDKKYRQEYKSITKRVNTSSKDGIAGDLQVSANVNTQTDIVSVVQVAQDGLKVGSRVYIIYNDDRPRLTPNVE